MESNIFVLIFVVGCAIELHAYGGSEAVYAGIYINGMSIPIYSIYRGLVYGTFVQDEHTCKLEGISRTYDVATVEEDRTDLNQ